MGRGGVRERGRLTQCYGSSFVLLWSAQNYCAVVDNGIPGQWIGVDRARAIDMWWCVCTNGLLGGWRVEGRVAQ